MPRAVEHLRTEMEKHLSWVKPQVKHGKQKQTDSWPRFARMPLLEDYNMVIRINVSPSLEPCQWPPVDPEGPHLVWDIQEKNVHNVIPPWNPSPAPRNKGRVSVTIYVMPLWAQLPPMILLGKGPSSVSAGSFIYCHDFPQTSLLCCAVDDCYGNR